MMKKKSSGWRASSPSRAAPGRSAAVSTVIISKLLSSVQMLFNVTPSHKDGPVSVRQRTERAHARRYLYLPNSHNGRSAHHTAASLAVTLLVGFSQPLGVGSRFWQTSHQNRKSLSSYTP